MQRENRDANQAGSRPKPRIVCRGEEELRDERVILLDTDDAVRTWLVDRQWETPNPYQFAAHVVIAIAQGSIANPVRGLQTPSAVPRPTATDGSLPDYRLSDRVALRHPTM